MKLFNMLLNKLKGKRNSKILYKVLNKDFRSPFFNFQYVLGKQYTCHDFDINSMKDCSRGFYATGIEGIPYSWKLGHRICVEVEVSGKSVEIDQYKRRYEKIKILRQVPIEELVEKAKKVEDKIGYKLSEVIDPIDPTKIPPPNKITDEHVDLLRQWVLIKLQFTEDIYVKAVSSLKGNGHHVIYDCVFGKFRFQLINNHNYSYWDYIGAYIASLFPKVKKWEWVEHKKGEYPFQSAVDLWHQGLIPTYENGWWYLFGGEKGEVLFKIKEDELLKERKV